MSRDQSKFLMQAHELAMGDNENSAAWGRLLKQLGPSIGDWWEAEEARGTEGPAMGIALADGFGQMLAGVIGTAAVPGGEERLLEALLDRVRETARAGIAVPRDKWLGL